MALSVAGKTAIVTGAGSGINFCFAKLLLEKKCNVVIADLSLRLEARDLIAQYESRTLGQAQAVFQKTDVRDWAQLDQAFNVAQSEFGGADIVCPGAGVFEPPWSNFWQPPGNPPSSDDPATSRYALLDINITHPIRMTQLAISHFVARKKRGVVIHISSIAGQVPVFYAPMYAASKHAISGLVRSLAPLEFPPNSVPSIRVNAVAPGVVKTPLWTDNKEKLRLLDEESDEWVTPEKVAEAMVDLIEKEEYHGGTVLEVGGGPVRRVEAFDAPRPSAKGNSVSNPKAEVDEIWKRLAEQHGRS